MTTSARVSARTPAPRRGPLPKAQARGASKPHRPVRIRPLRLSHISGRRATGVFPAEGAVFDLVGQAFDQRLALILGQADDVRGGVGIDVDGRFAGRSVTHDDGVDGDGIGPR